MKALDTRSGAATSISPADESQRLIREILDVREKQKLLAHYDRELVEALRETGGCRHPEVRETEHCDAFGCWYERHCTICGIPAL